MTASRPLRDTKLSAARIASWLEGLGFEEPKTSAKNLADLLAQRGQSKTFLRIAEAFFDLAAASPSPDRALFNLVRFLATRQRQNIDFLREPLALEALVRTFSISQALSDVLIRSPESADWLLAKGTLNTPKDKSGLRRDLADFISTQSSIPSPQSYALIRRFKRRELLRIGVCDLLSLASLEETTLEVSNLADVCVNQIYQVAFDELVKKHGTPMFEVEEGKPHRAEFAVIGMGKLGGQELNYSSDIDVIFLYSAEGETGRDKETAKRPALRSAAYSAEAVAAKAGTQARGAERNGDAAQPIHSISNHQFFSKLAEAITNEVGKVTEDGNVFRIDLRLRPEGSSGPIVRSLESYENYYAQWGQTWERMALIKARCIAGSQHLADEFFEVIQPFRYPRHMSERILREIAQIKERIENEIVREGRLKRHVKLGTGGIREIEFIVQTIQLLHGGKQPFIQSPNTLNVLEKLAQYELLPYKDCDALREAYRFLRTVEHRLQMEAELQTHTIPDDPKAQLRLARAVGFRTVEGFNTALGDHMARVRFIYEELLMSEFGGEEARMKELFVDKEQRQKLRADLEILGFRDPEAAIQTLQRLAMGPGYVQVSQRTTEMFLHTMPRLLDICKELATPDDALKQLDRFVEVYGARAALYEMFSNTPKLLELFLKLFDRSRFLSDVVLRRPELIEEVTRENILNRTLTTEQLLRDLKHPSEQREPREWLRIFKRAELLRIGLRDILGMESTEQIHTEITSLADACVHFALERCRTELKMKALPFCVFAMGKFGGRELGYGADLDVLFVTDDKTPNARAAQLATQLIDFLSKQTAEGSVFVLDPRLRPDGDQGPLVAPLSTYEAYYAKRAQLWERQSLTRARCVAGTPELAARFAKLACHHAFERGLSAEELKEILRMRERIEKERGDRGRPELEFKTGPGGLIDVEFLAQAKQMQHGGKHSELRTPNTLDAIESLGRLGLLEDSQKRSLLDGYCLLRRVESALRRLENQSVSALPSDPAEQGALAKRLGFAERDSFWKMYESHRKIIRQIFEEKLQ